MHRDTPVHSYGDIINTLLRNRLYGVSSCGSCERWRACQCQWHVGFIFALTAFVLLSKRTFMFSKNPTKHKHVAQWEFLLWVRVQLIHRRQQLCFTLEFRKTVRRCAAFPFETFYSCWDPFNSSVLQFIWPSSSDGGQKHKSFSQTERILEQTNR